MLARFDLHRPAIAARMLVMSIHDNLPSKYRFMCIVATDADNKVRGAYCEGDTRVMSALCNWPSVWTLWHRHMSTVQPLYIEQRPYAAILIFLILISKAASPMHVNRRSQNFTRLPEYVTYHTRTQESPRLTDVSTVAIEL